MKPEELKRLFSIIINDFKVNGCSFQFPESFNIDFIRISKEIEPINDIFSSPIRIKETEHTVQVIGVIKESSMIFEVKHDGLILCSVVEVPFKSKKTEDFHRFFIDAVKEYFEIE